jgi:hypothetical protein
VNSQTIDRSHAASKRRIQILWEWSFHEKAGFERHERASHGRDVARGKYIFLVSESSAQQTETMANAMRERRSSDRKARYNKKLTWSNIGCRLP